MTDVARDIAFFNAPMVPAESTTLFIVSTRDDVSSASGVTLIVKLVSDNASKASNTLKYSTKALPADDWPLGSNDFIALRVDLSCNTRADPEVAKNPNSYIRGESSSDQNEPEKENESVSSTPTVGDTKKFPGFGGALTTTVVEELARPHFKVITYEFPGCKTFGDNEKSITADPGMRLRDGAVNRESSSEMKSLSIDHEAVSA